MKGLIGNGFSPHLHNSRSALRIFLKFCRMKGANRYIKTLLFVEKKVHFRQFDLFRSFFTVWLGMVEIETGRCYYWILKLSGHDLLWLLLDPWTVRTWLGSLKTQDMISQVNIYVMGIVWILCDVYLWRSWLNRGSYGFVKLFNNLLY